MAPLVDLRLLRGPIAPTEWIDRSPWPAECGAECVFVGRTRSERSDSHGALLHLEYEAYDAMVLKVFESLADDAVRSFGCRAVRLLHALGCVPVGAASVVVQVAAPHRDGAFRACRMLIDRVKSEAPIWKQERFGDGAAHRPEGTVVGASVGASVGATGAVDR